MVESINGVIVKSLKKVVHERKLDWDVMLPAVLYACRTMAHSVLKISHYELLFGIEPLGEEKGVLQQYGRKIGFERLTLLQQRNGHQQYQVIYVEKEMEGNDDSVIKFRDKVLMVKHNRKNKLEPNYRDNFLYGFGKEIKQCLYPCKRKRHPVEARCQWFVDP